MNNKSLSQRLVGRILLAIAFFCLLIRPVQATPHNLPTLAWLPGGIPTCGMLLAASNCSDTNIQYVTQTSSDLRNWFPVMTNRGAPGGFTNCLPLTNSSGFFRLMFNPPPGPIFGAAIIAISNLELLGNGNTIDSFDSSDTNFSTGGQWDVTKRKANADVATLDSFTNAMVIDNSTIYGSVFTGPGTTQVVVEIGANGAVGDAAWIGSANRGIESNHWAGNFNAYFPDVPAPAGSGVALPAPDSNGVINLTIGNGFYITPFLPTYPLVVWAPSTVWVQGSPSLFPTSIVITNHGSLVLYVGRTNATGDSLKLSGAGTLNASGYAANLQIFGLPSLSGISIANVGFIGCIYAPEANFIARGGGSTSVLCSGAVVANTLTASGRFNFHYDESLLVNGPSR